MIMRRRWFGFYRAETPPRSESEQPEYPELFARIVAATNNDTLIWSRDHAYRASHQGLSLEYEYGQLNIGAGRDTIRIHHVEELRRAIAAQQDRNEAKLLRRAVDAFPVVEPPSPGRTVEG